MDERSVCAIPRLPCASFDRLGNAGCGDVRGPRAFAAHVFKAAERVVGDASHTARGRARRGTARHRSVTTSGRHILEILVDAGVPGRGNLS